MSSEQSIHNAAVSRAERTDWQARARREAAALLDECGLLLYAPNRDTLLTVLAVAWLQGVNLGAHETLAQVETSFDRLRETL